MIMKKAITDGILVTGDGETKIDGSLVLIKDEIIIYAGESKDFDRDDYEIIDASGSLLIPGIINAHAHGIVPNAPLFSSGSKALSDKQAEKNLRKHLSQGTTAILSVDGFANPEDVVNINHETLLNIKTAITHTPKSYEAAMKIDGEGIQKKFNNDNVLRNFPWIVGALGECGSGATLGGGVQDYKFIPEMVERHYGVKLTADIARQIKEAIVGRFIDEGAYDVKKLEEVLSTSNIDAPLEEVKQRIIDCVMPCFRLSLESITESADAKYNLPVIIHSAAASMDTIDKITLCRGYGIIAAHSNHSSYKLDEALEFAEEIKKREVIIDISTFDTLNTNNQKEIEYFMRFLERGVVDTVSTDYGGGNHCSILSMLDLAVKDGVVSLPQAIKLATHNPAKAVPILGERRGLVREGYHADIVFVDTENIGKVGHVMIKGEYVS